MKKIDIFGDPPETVCDLAGAFQGGAWSPEDVIVFGDQARHGMLRVPAAGGVPAPVTTADPPGTIHAAPVFLPDGRHFLYLQARPGLQNIAIYAGSLDAKPAEQSTTPILRTPWDAMYAPSVGDRTGYLLFIRERTLLAQAFDPRRLALRGQPMPVADQIDDTGAGRGGWGAFWASRNGVLAFKRSDAAAGSQIGWYDREGHLLGTLGEAGPYQDVSLSPDGSRAAVHRGDGQNDLWLLDVARKVSERFTFDAQRDEAAVWSPDGAQIVFASERRGPFNLFRKSASGAGEAEPLLSSGDVDVPNDWSPDGEFLLYSEIDKSRHSGLWLLPLRGARKPIPFLTTAFNESHGRFSPNGRWIAYTSEESGKSEVYVRPFPASNAGGKWLISSGGGYQPLWRRDGKELLYFSPDSKLMSVDVKTTSSFQVSAPKVLFTVPMADGPAASNFHRWDIAPDGQHFLINVAVNTGKSQPITVVLN